MNRAPRGAGQPQKRKRGAHFPMGSPPAPHIRPARVRVRAGSPLQRSQGSAIPRKRPIPVDKEKRHPPRRVPQTTRIPGRRSDCREERVLSVLSKRGRRIAKRAVGFRTHQRFAHNGVAELLLPPTRRTKKLPPGPGAAEWVGSRQLYQCPCELGFGAGASKVPRALSKD